MRVWSLGNRFILFFSICLLSKPEALDFVLEGQVLHPEVGVVLSALRSGLNIGWSRHPAGRCA